MNLIQADHITKKIGSFQINDVSFALPPGYICGLVGQNGAGKTTLLHLLLGLYQPDAGSILISGMDYKTSEKRIHNMVGTVLSEDLFNPSMTLIQNGDWYGKYYSNYSHENMKNYLSCFHLEKGRKFGRLSKGEKLKFQFAFALSHDAMVLILDEPAGNFDLGFREQFFRIIKEFIRDGTRSVVLATQITEDLDRIADYIIYLENGNKIFSGDIEELHRRYHMVSGEACKIRQIPQSQVIHLEENQYGAKALVVHSDLNHYDAGIKISDPTIGELMYFYAKRRVSFSKGGSMGGKIYH